MGQANDPLHRHRGYVWLPYLDPEKEQATLRVILGGLATAVYGALAWSAPTHAAIASFHALALYLIYGVATRLIISRMQRQSNLRLAFTTVADQALLTVVLGAGGALTLPMLWARAGVTASARWRCRVERRWWESSRCPCCNRGG
jgi:hypothetical protein